MEIKKLSQAKNKISQTLRRTEQNLSKQINILRSLQINTILPATLHRRLILKKITLNLS